MSADTFRLPATFNRLAWSNRASPGNPDVTDGVADAEAGDGR
jgi:hypothetical protein